MKYSKYLFFFFYVFLCLSVFAQTGITHARMVNDYDVFDTSNLRVAYSFDYINNVEKPSDISSDVVYLDIGAKMSKCYSHIAYIVDSIYTIDMLIGDMTPRKSANEALAVEVYKNNLLRQTKVVHRTPIVNEDDFLYTDDYCNFDWEIHLNKKTIHGYTCQKATTTFRGRTWEAWFTTDIPVSDGPWKFCGLMGLILEVFDSQKHCVFTCTGIEQKQIPIVMYKWNYQKTTREKLNALFTDFHANVKKRLEDQGVKVYTMKGGEMVPAPDNFSVPYNPIELE
jgi:GLPGLI family protein